MKADANTRLVAEPGDSEMQQELRVHYNAMMDALKWFYESGVRVSVKRSRTGYSITFAAPKGAKR